jgi:hypothetical protein
MPQFQTIKSVFNGGEMSPLMDGRTDSEKYATGCRLLENFLPRSYGGVFKRPGTQFKVSDTHTQDLIRTIAWKRSTEVNYILGFKENAIKVWDASDFSLVATLTTTYTVEEIRALHYCQLNDIMHLTVATKHPAVITRASDGTWSIINTPFQFAPALDPPSETVTMLLEYDANDWVTATSYSVGNFVLYLNDLYRCKTANSDVAFTLAKWDKAVYQKPWNVGAAYVAGDVTEYFGSNYFCITAHTASSANRPGTGAQWVLITITDYRLIASAATFDADEVGSTWLLSPGSNSRIATEPIAAAPATTTSAAIFIQGSYVARTSWETGKSPAGSVIQLQESLDRINFTTIREWAIGGNLEGTISYTAEAPNTGGWYRMMAVRSGADANVSRMTVEPVVGKLDIPFKIESYVSATQVRGIPKLAVDSLIPNEVLGTTFPVWRKGAFSETRGFPRTVAFHDNRLWFAGTELYPTRIWASQIDDFYTFLTGSLDTSGIDITLAATEANDIQWLSSFKRTLVVGTTGEEWTMDSGEQDSVMTPSNARARRWSRYGSNSLQPVLAGDGLLWLTRDNRLREFAYVFEKDGYSAPDMSLLAEHIPNSVGAITEINYSQSPDSIVWLTYSSGEVAGFSYDRENNVTAWHRQEFNSINNRECESICVIYSGSSSEGDTLVFLFDNADDQFSLETITGGAMIASMTSSNPRYNEEGMVGPNCFCDAWRWVSGTYNAGTGLTTFNLGASIYDNEKVVVSNWTTNAIFLNDDGSPKEFSVSSGVVTITGNHSGYHVIGIPYNAWIVPNRIELQLQDGTSQMRKWRINSVAFRLFQSKYGNICIRPTVTDQRLTMDWSDATAVDYTDMDENIFNSWTVWNTNVSTFAHKSGQTKIQMFNGPWDDSADITIGSRHPLPFNLLSMILKIEIGDNSSAGT